jgi:transcriptional regulator of acetoin/glycerol metabolism
VQPSSPPLSAGAARTASAGAAGTPSAPRGSGAAPPRRGTLSEHQRSEREQIVAALEQTGWNRARAAELIGMPRRTFYRRLSDYGLQ